MASTAAPPGTSAVRQSSRQTRTNPSRVSKTAGRMSQSTVPSSGLAAGGGGGGGGIAQSQNPHHHHHHHHRHRHPGGFGASAGNNPTALASAGAGADADPATAAPTIPDDIYPGITHFTDTIGAIPREFRRHESLLKEVDGKSWVLEDKLPALVGNAAEQVMRPSRMGVRPGEESTHPSKIVSLTDLFYFFSFSFSAMWQQLF